MLMRQRNTVLCGATESVWHVGPAPELLDHHRYVFIKAAYLIVFEQLPHEEQPSKAKE